MNVKMMIQSLVDEYKEVESLEELEALNKANEEEHGPNGPELKEAYEEAMKRLTPSTPTVDDMAKKIAELERLIASLTGKAVAIPTAAPTRNQPPVQRAPRVSKKYKLLKLDVSWTNKPQVHAVMRILAAHMSVGDVVDETQIVEMMIANEDVLATRQGGKRIWDYYKGTHNDGLIAHGNIEVVA